VLCGRGSAVNTHIGNVVFRNVMEKNHHQYQRASKSEKADIALQLVLRMQVNGNARFLMRLPAPEIPAGFNKKCTDFWYEIDAFKASKKAAQRLREGGKRTKESLSSSSSAAGAAIRKSKNNNKKNAAKRCEFPALVDTRITSAKPIATILVPSNSASSWVEQEQAIQKELQELNGSCGCLVQAEDEGTMRTRRGEQQATPVLVMADAQCCYDEEEPLSLPAIATVFGDIFLSADSCYSSYFCSTGAVMEEETPFSVSDYAPVADSSLMPTAAELVDGIFDLAWLV
jgi:hypothetical protein